MTVLIGMFLLGLFIALGSWVVSWTTRAQGRDRRQGLLRAGRDGASVRSTRGRARAASAHAAAGREASSSSRRRTRSRRCGGRSRARSRTSRRTRCPGASRSRPRGRGRRRRSPTRLEPAAAPGWTRSTTAEEDRPDPERRQDHRDPLPGRSLILLVASTILIANTIRLSIFSRRREIEVMKLVGATNWFVRGPFMLEGSDLRARRRARSRSSFSSSAKEFALPAIFRRQINLRPTTTSRPGLPGRRAHPGRRRALVGALGSGITLRRFLRV